MKASKEQQEKKKREKKIADKFLSGLGNKYGEKYCIIDGDRERPDFLIKNTETDKEIGLEIFELVKNSSMQLSDKASAIRSKYGDYLMTYKKSHLVRNFLDKFRNRYISIFSINDTSECSLNISKNRINNKFYDSMLSALLNIDLPLQGNTMVTLDISDYTIIFTIQYLECDLPMLDCTTSESNAVTQINNEIMCVLYNKYKAISKYECEYLWLLAYYDNDFDLPIDRFHNVITEYLNDNNIPPSVKAQFIFNCHSGEVFRYNM